MTQGFIRYRERKYKYQLIEDYQHQVNILGFRSDGGLFSLDDDGTLTIREGYAWDGASGPTVDSDSSMRASLVHDVLYQMIREGYLPPSCKNVADRELHKLLINDGMDTLRANMWYDMVNAFGDSSCEVGSGNKEIRTSPEQGG